MNFWIFSSGNVRTRRGLALNIQNLQNFGENRSKFSIRTTEKCEKFKKFYYFLEKKSEVYQLLCEKRNFRVVRIFGLVTELQFSKEFLCKNLMLEGHVLVQEQFHQQ